MLKRIFILTIVALLTQMLMAQEVGTDTIPSKKKNASPQSIQGGSSQSKSALDGYVVPNDPDLQLSPDINTVPLPPQIPNPLNSEGRRGNVSSDLGDWSYTPKRRRQNNWFRDISGVRFFLDHGATIGLGNNMNIRYDLYVSAGYQFNPIFYLGAGQGFSLTLNNQYSSGPAFINPRINFLV